MAKAYPMVLRNRLLSLVEGGVSVRQASKQLLLSYMSALQWVRRFKATGSVEAKRQGGYKKSLLEPYTAWLSQLLEEESDLTLSEIQSRLNETHQIRVGITTLWRFLGNWTSLLKKKSLCL
jgi:transposase